MQNVLDRYLATWNETDPTARRALLTEHWAPDASYTDPLAAVRGLDEVDALIAGVHEQFPGFVFAAAGPLDAHHDQARFTWSLGPAGAEPPVVGFDVVVTDADGRIATVLGFIDKAPG